MKAVRPILLIVLLAAIATGCSIQKRRYLKGFHIERRGVFRKAEPVAEEIAVRKEPELIRTETAVVTPENNPPETDSLPAEPLAASRETDHPAIPLSSHSSQTIAEIPQPELTAADSRKFVRQQQEETDKDEHDGTWIILFLLILCPPLWPAYAYRSLFLIILCFLVWAAVDVLLILLIPEVLWIILGILGWHLLCLYLVIEIDQ